MTRLAMAMVFGFVALPTPCSAEQSQDTHMTLPIYRVTVRDPAQGQIQLITFMSPAEIKTIGGLPSELVVGQMLARSDGLGPDNFQSNQAFVDFMHSIVASTCPEDREYQESARKIGNGHLNVDDGRSVLAGLEKQPEDVIGRFRVVDGTIDVESYQPNLDYQIVSEHGMMTPHPTLQDAILEALRNLRVDDDSTKPSKGR